MAANPRLLVVDDEISVARTLAMVFEQQGFTVEVASSGADALQRLKRSPRFDIVITDLNMESPQSGFHVVRAARQLNRRPIIIVATGYATESNLEMAWSFRVDHIILKPTPVEELRNAVTRLLSLRQDSALGY